MLQIIEIFSSAYAISNIYIYIYIYIYGAFAGPDKVLFSLSRGNKFVLPLLPVSDECRCLHTDRETLCTALPCPVQ